MMTDLTCLHAVVTGSTRGLGLAFAKALHHAGASVVVNGRTEQACQTAVTAIDARGVRLDYVAGPVDDEQIADALIERCRSRFGGIGLVVNNAGITRDKSLLKMTVDEFDEVLSVHLRGTWLMCRAAARGMRDTGGSILNLTSGSALYGLVGQSNYAAAKGGVIALTRALSVELARYSISVNALYPIAHTDMTAPVLKLAGPDSDLASVFGEPDDIAALLPILSATARPDFTGQVMSFDGNELSIWSHPSAQFRSSVRAPQDSDQFALAVEAVVSHPATLNPDRIGTLTRSALKR